MLSLKREINSEWIEDLILEPNKNPIPSQTDVQKIQIYLLLTESGFCIETIFSH